MTDRAKLPGIPLPPSSPIGLAPGAIRWPAGSSLAILPAAFLAVAFAVAAGGCSDSNDAGTTPSNGDGKTFTGASSSGASSSGASSSGASSSGASSSGASSSGASSSSGAATSCTPGERTCGSLTELKTCGADSKWAATPCNVKEACDDGACATVICKAGALSCDGNTIVKCSARGTKLAAQDACAGKQVCAGGKCVDKSCTVGESRCVGNALVTCIEKNEWQKTVCGADQTCVDTTGNNKATCMAQMCKPGATVCQGDKVFTCGADGLTKKLADNCAKAGNDGKARACLGGKCVQQACKALEKTCDGDAVATCKADHSGWQKTPCKSGETCLAGACAKKQCAPSETFCDALTVMQCDATGTKKKEVKKCNGNLQQCKQGGCVDLAIVCGDGFCDVGESFDNCKQDCKVKSTLSGDFDKVHEKATIGQPMSPRALTKPMPHASYTSHTMALGGKWLYVVDRDNGTLVLMDRDKLAAVHTLKVGGRPENVLVTPDGTAWVTVRDDDAVVKIPAGETSMVKSVKWQVGLEPTGMALAPGGKVLLVALQGERAVIGIDIQTGTEVARSPLKEMPKSIAVGLKGKAVVNVGTGEFAAIDAQKMGQGNALQPVFVQATFAKLRATNPVKVCRGFVEVKTRKPNRGLAAALQPESGMMLLAHVLTNPGDGQDVLAAAGVKPKFKQKPKPKVITTCSSGGYGSTCSTKVIPGPTPCQSAPVRPFEVSISMLGPDLKVAKGTQSHAAILDDQSKRSFLARFDQPSGITHHPTMSMAFVAAMGTNNIMVINTAAPDPMQWPIADITVGTGPKSVVISPNGKKAWVHNTTSFTVSEIDLAPLLKFVDPLKPNASMKKIKPLFMQQTKAIAYGKDPLPPKAAMGRVVFHNAMNSRLSASNRFACATCHHDGTEDKNVWFVSEGPRQTPALAGRLKDSAPFNWMGTKFTLADNIMATTHRMGGTGLMKHELEGLTAFVRDGLVEPRNPFVSKTGKLTKQQAEGKKLFNDPKVACSTCHAGTATTDGAQHDVGTATTLELQVQKIFAGKDKPQKVLFNTPTLRGVWYTAPYLHDGSAKTLKEALKNTSKTMGRTDHLTDKQLDALVAYLRTL